jgi:hypothetical protein
MVRILDIGLGYLTLRTPNIYPILMIHELKKKALTIPFSGSERRVIK